MLSFASYESPLNRTRADFVLSQSTRLFTFLPSTNQNAQKERQAFGTMWICKSDNRLTADIRQNALYVKGFPQGAIVLQSSKSHFSVIKKAYVSHSPIFYYCIVYYKLFILYNYSSNMYCTITVMWTMGCAKKITKVTF